VTVSSDPESAALWSELEGIETRERLISELGAAFYDEILDMDPEQAVRELGRLKLIDLSVAELRRRGALPKT
jgi:hypothetical protein